MYKPNPIGIKVITSTAVYFSLLAACIAPYSFARKELRELHQEFETRIERIEYWKEIRQESDARQDEQLRFHEILILGEEEEDNCLKATEED